MVAMVAHKEPIKARDYLVLEASAETRHEFIGGEIYAMAGSDYRHNMICTNLVHELRKALGERRCSVLGSDQRVKVESLSAYLYPDVTVTCLDPKLVAPKPPSLVNPQVVFEVASQSTERFDRFEKWAAYQQIPSLSDYVMLASSRMFVEHYQLGPNDTWVYRKLSGNDALSISNGVSIPIAALYWMVPELDVSPSAAVADLDDPTT